MSEAQVGAAQPRDVERPKDPRFEAAAREGDGDTGREMLAHAAMGAKLSETEESSALGWLLGNPRPMIYGVPVDFDTPDGMRKITFVIQAQDGHALDEIERRHTNEASGLVDAPSVNSEMVWKATLAIEDATGRETTLDSEEFLTFPTTDERGDKTTMKIADPRIALERRFRTQMGLLTGVASEVRRISGYTRDRVGSAQRRLVDASGN